MDSNGFMPGESWEVWKSVPGYAPGVARHITTDSDGRFRINNLGLDRTVDLIIEGPDIAWSQARVLTRPAKPVTRTLNFGGGLPQTVTSYGAQFDFTAQAGHAVRGTVRDAKTHQPLAGVCVLSDSVGMHRSPSITDEQGHYRLEGFPPGKQNDLLVVPGNDLPYVLRSMKVPEKSDTGEISLDIDLYRGVWLTGKVTDKVSGEPVAAELRFLPYRSNKYVAGIPDVELAPNEGRAGPVGGNEIKTRDDGTYRIVVTPGAAIIGARAPPRDEAADSTPSLTALPTCLTP